MRAITILWFVLFWLVIYATIYKIQSGQITDLNRGRLTMAISDVRNGFRNVCGGVSIGQQVRLSIPTKGLLVIYSCPELLALPAGDKIRPINWKEADPPDIVDELKKKCSEPEKCKGVCKSEACAPPSGTPVPSGFCLGLPDGTPCDYTCPAPNPEHRALLAYGWDTSWDWWLISETKAEIRGIESIDCEKKVSVTVALAEGDYQRLIKVEKDATTGNEEVKMLGS